MPVRPGGRFQAHHHRISRGYWRGCTYVQACECGKVMARTTRHQPAAAYTQRGQHVTVCARCGKRL